MKKNLFALIIFCTLLAFTVTCQSQIIVTFAGNGTAASTGDGGTRGAASFNHPGGAYYDHSGNVFVVEYTGCKVRKISPSGIVSTFAGTGAYGYGGDGGPATNASFAYPIDILEDSHGNYYVTDNSNMRIRKIDTSGIITTFAGNGTVGYYGDGGPATNAALNNPNRIGIDIYNNIYIGDADNNVVRKVDTLGIITTVAGTGTAGFSGDGGPATAAKINQAMAVTFDGNGNMYIADGHNSRIRKVTPSGIISTFAGNGTSGMTGDGGPATDATLEYPNGVTCDQSCNVYYTDWNGQKVRKINGSGIISTVVANGTAGFNGDGGLATLAEVDGPNNLTFDPAGNLFIPDFYNNRVREIENLGESGVCPPVVPIASFTAASDSICKDSCMTFVSTSTGTIDSVRWVATGASIGAPTSLNTSICFTTTGPVQIKFYVYGVGSEDSSITTINVKNCTTGVPAENMLSDNIWISQTGYNELEILSSIPIIGSQSIAIVDATGRTLAKTTWPAGSHSMLLNGLYMTSGLYFVRIEGEGCSKVIKWVKY